METLCLKKTYRFFSNWKVLLINNFQFPLITQYVIQYVFQIIFNPIGLDQMKMGWIFNNSAGKKHI